VVVGNSLSTLLILVALALTMSTFHHTSIPLEATSSLFQTTGIGGIVGMLYIQMFLYFPKHRE
jgi:hypothetical protein